MRALGPALAGILAVTVPIAAHASGPSSSVNTGPAPCIMLVRDGGGSGQPAGAIGAHTTAGHMHQWKGGWVSPHWGPHGQPLGWGPHGWQGVPTYWVWGPSGGAFDYPFSDWRGPTGGWGNP
jgi:hypothetical protein